MPEPRIENVSRRLSSVNAESAMLLQMLRRELLLALESKDPIVFQIKLNWILENSREHVDLVLRSGLDSEGKTALHIAVETRFIEAVKFLLSTGKVDVLATAGEGGWTALHTAVDLGDANLTKILLPTFPNIYLPPHQVLAALRQPTASSCAVTALHMAVRRNSASCAVVLLQTANALVHGHSGGWTTSEEEDDSAFVERVQQHRDFHGQVADGSRKLNKLKDLNGDTPLHWAVKTNNYAMARLLCSYGARPRHFYNNQGQTPLALAKYVLQNAKMTKLLTSFSSDSSPKTMHSMKGENENPPGGIDDIKNSPEDAIIPMELPPHRAVRDSGVDGTCARLQRTSIGVEMMNSSQTESIEQYEQKQTLCGISNNAGISSRPYLHRQVKTACSQVPTDRRFDSDSLEPTARQRSNSLKVGRRELEMFQQKLPSLFPRQNLKRAVTHYPRPISLKARRKASLMDPADYYPMASPQRGICVVINNMTYWHPKFQNRGGCDKDERRVEKVFRDLGFMVKVLRNLSSGEMQSELAYVGRKTDHSAYDAFVAVIMTHGGLGELYGVNGDAFPVHRLTLDFTAEICPSLAGKPKLFFIQACRGDEYQLGYAVPVNGTSEDEISMCQVSFSPNPLRFTTSKLESNEPEYPEEEPAIAAAKLPRKQRLIPSFADFLLSYATLAGFKAQRDPQQGSIYIQTLCHYLELYGKSRSLLDIVTSVHREVSEKVFREAESTDRDGGTIFQQTPEVRHTLTRRVKFV
ncbi:unnamed protein product [Hymenolepis diminuta]|uniref:ANK_REP_REGION domain-containing protein n=2 Tax=Hymenolepis diminuta TaxID=6216 RepID=A0A158QBK2_HYMDI|nr:unnamed protein product [Hymenolepis diminuta]